MSLTAIHPTLSFSLLPAGQIEKPQRGNTYFIDHQGGNEQAFMLQTHAYPAGEPLDYFNAGRFSVVRQSSTRMDRPTSLLPAEWQPFQAACEKARADLEHAMTNLKQSRFKGYLLKEDKRPLLDLLRTGLRQVQIVEAAAVQLAVQPTRSNWQFLKEALNQLEEIRSAAAPSSGPLVADCPTPSVQTGWIARAWEEVQYFLGPVIVTGWGILIKLGVLAEEITQNVPLIFGLIGTLITVQQRLTARIDQLKTEDRDQLIAVCHSLTAAFKKMEGKEVMERITNNMARTFQEAANAAQAANQTKQVVEKEIAALQEENAQLKKQLEDQNEQLQNLAKGQQQTNTLLAQILLQKNDALEKKA